MKKRSKYIYIYKAVKTKGKKKSQKTRMKRKEKEKRANEAISSLFIFSLSEGGEKGGEEGKRSKQ